MNQVRNPQYQETSVKSTSAVLRAAALTTLTLSGVVALPLVRPAAPLYRLVWKHSLNVFADSAPTIIPGVKLAHGKTATVAYVLAGNNSSDCHPGNPVKHSTVYAYTVSGTFLWKQSTSGQSRCTTSAPAYHSGFVYTPGLDGKVHKYNAATGAQWKKNGWPIPYTKQPYVEKASAALEVSGQYLYTTTSGFIGDAGHYEGHVVTINLLTDKAAVWNSLCSNIKALINDRPGTPDYCPDAQAGMFGRGQAVSDPLNHDFYVVTGNGPWNGHTDWGDSILKLNRQGTTLLDAFTPTDQASLNSEDLDLGSTAPAILPPITDDGKTWHLLTQGGKGGAVDGGDAVIWLINRNRMGSAAGPGHLGGQLDYIDSPGGTEVLTKPAVWINPKTGRPIIIYANDSGVTAYSIDTSGATPTLAVDWSFSSGMSSPVIAGNSLFLAHDGELQMFNPATGNAVWSSDDSGVGGTIGGVHWQYPAVSGNWVLMCDTDNMIYGYKHS
jgi:hypothetical protein